MDKKTLMLLAEYWKDPVAKISVTTTLTISVLIALVYRLNNYYLKISKC